MIVPEKEKDNSRRYASAGITIAVCLVGYLLLAFSSMPEVRSNREVFREISELNITQLMPKIEPAIEQVAEPEAASQTETQVEAPVPVSTPQRVDLSDILPEGLKVDLTVTRTPRETINQQAAEARVETRSLRLEDSDMGRVGGLQSLTDRSLSSPTATRLSLGDNGLGESGLGMTGGNRIGDRTGGLTSGQEGAGLLGGARGRQGDRTGPEVGLKSLEDFGDDYSDFEPIYRALVEWMKKNPSDLPVPVTRLMAQGRWNPDFLTSRVPFIIGDKQFDLLLMCKEELYEVHIILVEHQEATYLIDRNFQKQSNFLRVGDVGYQENEIADIGSQMRAAGENHTQEFYQIFLSWWDSVRHEVE